MEKEWLDFGHKMADRLDSFPCRYDLNFTKYPLQMWSGFGMFRQQREESDLFAVAGLCPPGSLERSVKLSCVNLFPEHDLTSLSS